MSSPEREPEELEGLLRRYSGSVAYDVGAYVGDTTELLSERFRLVVACEPHPLSYAQLSKRAYPGVVETLNRALGPRGGWLPVQVRAGKEVSGQYTSAAADWQEWGEVMRTLRVRCTTVDRLRADYGAPDLIKVDVEGSEVQVLKGAAKTLDVDRPDLFVEVHTKEIGAALRRMLEPLYPSLRRVPHPHYKPGSWYADNHFWLVSSS